MSTRDATPDGPALAGDPLAGESVAVVGGGIGGLATAPYLAAMGADVTVLERNDRLGGVATRVEADGFRFDAGPSWYLMPDVFERYFDQFGRAPGDYYALERLDPHYRVCWKDGDRVVCNANPAHVERDLLAPADRPRDVDYWAERTYAPSAYMLYLGIEGSVDGLEHHTLVLPTDWDPHFEHIFEDPAWPDDPAYYVNVPSLTDDAVAPDGHETVVVLVPVAPGLEDDREHRRRFREQVLSDVATHTGVDLRERVVVEREACVSEFARRVNAPQGTALGLAHTLRQTGPFRPGHRDGPDGLYYVGGYTTPGIGVPMCLVSADHTAHAVRADAVASGPLASLR